MPTFAIVGNSTRAYPAERGTAHIVISLEGAQRELVVRDSIELHNRVAEAAKLHRERGAATWWSADRVFVSAFKEYVKNSETTVTKHRSRSNIEVKFRDFAVLTEWVSALAETKGVTISGLTWALTQARRVEAEKAARIAAVKDAMTKATDYAYALDLAAPTLQAIYEPGLRPHVPMADGTHAGVATRGAGGTAAHYQGLELKPNDIEVTASISADFEV